jgi:ABC-type Fe3+/spermidine/putrescine transport system ATPase subunit
VLGGVSPGGVSFDVARGALVALMGPSGSGKTTLLRAIAGLEPFDEGTIAIEEVTLGGGAPHSAPTLRQLRRKVGFVFQFHHLFEHLSAVKNVWLAPVHAHGDRAWRAAAPADRRESHDRRRHPRRRVRARLRNARAAGAGRRRGGWLAVAGNPAPRRVLRRFAPRFGEIDTGGTLAQEVAL